MLTKLIFAQCKTFLEGTLQRKTNIPSLSSTRRKMRKYPTTLHHGWLQGHCIKVTRVLKHI